MIHRFSIAFWNVNIFSFIGIAVWAYSSHWSQNPPKTPWLCICWGKTWELLGLVYPIYVSLIFLLIVSCSLKSLVMLKMLFEVVMDMILMGTDCGLIILLYIKIKIAGLITSQVYFLWCFLNFTCVFPHRWNWHMVDVAIHRQQIVIVMAVVEVAGVEHPGVLTTAVWNHFTCLMVSFTKLHVFLWANSSFFLVHYAVLVTGLPSSASWQDLKVTMSSCDGYLFTS